MRIIYHILRRDHWEQLPAGDYRADSLASEGFIHCSNREQVAWAANKFHAQETDLVALCIDADHLTSPVRDEDPGNGQHFPHIYGPVERGAIVGIEPLTRGADGGWLFV